MVCITLFIDFASSEKVHEFTMYLKVMDLSGLRYLATLKIPWVVLKKADYLFVDPKFKISEESDQN